MTLVDTHCHLDLPQFDGDRDAVVRRALDHGVHAMVVIGFNPERWSTSANLGREYPCVCRAVGLHPNDASLWSDELRECLERELDRGDAVAVGEIGLDFFRDRASFAEQIRAFEAQVDIALERDLPIVVHQRNAEEDVLAVLEGATGLRGVMHCFTGDWALAERFLELGMYLGFGGVLTFPKSTVVRDAAISTPLDRILLETDSPYLAPQPWRGKRNEPAYAVSVADTLASIKHLPLDAVAAATTANAVNLLGGTVADAIAAGERMQS